MESLWPTDGIQTCIERFPIALDTSVHAIYLAIDSGARIPRSCPKKHASYTSVSEANLL